MLNREGGHGQLGARRGKVGCLMLLAGRVEGYNELRRRMYSFFILPFLNGC